MCYFYEMFVDIRQPLTSETILKQNQFSNHNYEGTDNFFDSETDIHMYSVNLAALNSLIDHLTTIDVIHKDWGFFF